MPTSIGPGARRRGIKIAASARQPVTLGRGRTLSFFRGEEAADVTVLGRDGLCRPSSRRGQGGRLDPQPVEARQRGVAALGTEGAQAAVIGPDAGTFSLVLERSRASRRLRQPPRPACAAKRETIRWPSQAASAGPAAASQYA